MSLVVIVDSRCLIVFIATTIFQPTCCHRCSRGRQRRRRMNIKWRKAPITSLQYRNKSVYFLFETGSVGIVVAPSPFPSRRRSTFFLKTKTSKKPYQPLSLLFTEIWSTSHNCLYCSVKYTCILHERNWHMHDHTEQAFHH